MAGKVDGWHLIICCSTDLGAMHLFCTEKRLNLHILAPVGVHIYIGLCHSDKKSNRDILSGTIYCWICVSHEQRCDTNRRLVCHGDINNMVEEN